ncbi:MAG: leucine-rich repeat protein, partial [Oscillospiraceae bacterium]|nr:leucine-rich repeat protein [Oscillospiraceae bacterium]
MKRTAKCILAMLICLLFLVPVLWTDAGAASGTCGENLTWNLTNGTLTISGRGEMTDFDREGAPWYRSRTSIRQIVVEPGVSGIGNYAFQDCTALTSVSMPGGVLRIGQWAFDECTALTSVVIPYGTVTIDTGAFYGCTKLAEVVFPTDLLTTIGDSVFSNCKALTSIELPDTVTSIGYNSFGYCDALEDLVLSENLSYIGAAAFWYCYGLKEVEIPASVTYMGDYAFYYCQNIRGVYISDLAAWCGIRFATANANPLFMSWGNLYLNGVLVEDMAIPAGITAIRDYAFANLNSLRSLTLPASLTSIGRSAFFDCSKLESVVMTDGVTSIGPGAFQGCGKLTEMTLGAGVTEVAGTAFNSCTLLESIGVAPANPAFASVDGVLFSKDGTALLRYPEGKAPADGAYAVPSAVTRLGDCAFTSCAAVTSLTLPEGLESIGSSSLSRMGAAELTIPASVTELGDHAFEFNRNLTTVRILGSVPLIGSGVFNGCSNLTTVLLQGSVSVLGEGAFSGFTHLTTVQLSDDLTEIGNNAFSECTALAEITIPAGVTAIGTGAFYGCTALAAVDLGEGLESIGGSAFYGCTALTALDLPESLDAIGERAFYDCTALAALTLPGEMTEIGAYAFYNCSHLPAVQLPQGLTALERNLFNKCSSLASVTIPEGVTRIEPFVFSGCRALTEITFPASLTELGFFTYTNMDDEPYDASYLFEACTRLARVTFSYPLASIPGRTFTDCSALAEVYYYGTEEDWAALGIGDSNGYLTGAALRVCGRLTVTEQPAGAILQPGAAALHTAADGLPGAMLSYRWQRKPLGGEWTDCSAGTAGFDTDTLTFETAVENSGDRYRCIVSDNYGNTAVTEPALLLVAEGSLRDGGACGPDTVWTLDPGGCLTVFGVGGMDDFERVTQNLVTSITTPWYPYAGSIVRAVVREGVTRIGNYAFSDLRSLQEISIPRSTARLGAHCIDNCSALASLTIPEGVTALEEYAVHSCRNLASLTLPDSLTSVGAYGLANNDALTHLRIPAGVRALPTGCFGNSGSLRSVELPDTLTSIGVEAFLSCTALESIRIPDGVTFIGSKAFGFCSSLTTLVFPDGLTAISSHIFTRSKGIVSVAIPGSVTSIGNGAFANTSALADVYFYGTEAQWAAVAVGNTNDNLGKATIHFCTPLTVTVQPEDYEGPLGSTASFTVEAEGESLSYQWWVKTPSASKFSKSSITGPVYEVELTQARNGNRLYCEITDVAGKTRRTDTVAMTVDPDAVTLAITKQPGSYRGVLGSTAYFSVEAQGEEPLTYQWYVKKPTATRFSKSSITGPVYEVELTSARNGNQLYCVVTDAYGNSVQSDTVSMTVAEALAITAQPEDYVGPLGSTAAFT